MKPITRFSIIAAATVLVALSVTSVFAQNPDQKAERFQRTFNLNSGGTLVVDNYKGTIHVSGTDGNQVVVDVYKRFDGNSSDRKWWMDNVEVNFHNDSGKVEVAVKYPNQICLFCWNDRDYTASVELDVRVPRQTSVRVESYKPDIRIVGIQGDIRINSYKSPIVIEGTTGAVRIDTYKETIRLSNVTLRGALDVKSYKADADISARSLGDSLNVETEKGSITLRLPRNAGFDVDFSGGRRSSFQSDFPLGTQASNRWDRDVRGTVNQGGAHLRLRTERGSVSLQKDSGGI
jgi:hypothetical protein